MSPGFAQTPAFHGAASRRARAFTLLELMAVVAILSILAAIGVPSVIAARRAADRSRTRVQFAQWALACTQFRQEYGFLPSLGTGNRLTTADDTTAFVRVLTGRNPDGTPITSPAQLGGNTRRINFLTLSESDLAGGRLVDAFGNTELGVLRDSDGDGLVRPGVDGTAPAVTAIATGQAFAPGAADLPPAGVRAEVIFYSAGRGTSAEDLVLSWK